MKKGPNERRNMQIRAYLRESTYAELAALADRTERPMSWWVDQAVRALLRSQAVYAPDASP